MLQSVPASISGGHSKKGNKIDMKKACRKKQKKFERNIFQAGYNSVLFRVSGNRNEQLSKNRFFFIFSL
jgi:hypothetical protein